MNPKTAVRLKNASAFPVSNRYTGQIDDDETGLYYYGARYYDPQLGRFIQPDTEVSDPLDPQTFNPYTYAANNPLRYVDPTGHDDEEGGGSFVPFDESFSQINILPFYSAFLNAPSANTIIGEDIDLALPPLGANDDGEIQPVILGGSPTDPANKTMNEELKQLVLQVIELLVAGKYAELEILTKRQRLTAQEMNKAISDYGRKLILPPDDAFGRMDVVEVRNAEPRQWSITMPLWTREEGRSDLSIGVTLIADVKGFRIELDDVHVL